MVVEKAEMLDKTLVVKMVEKMVEWWVALMAEKMVVQMEQMKVGMLAAK